MFHVKMMRRRHATLYAYMQDAGKRCRSAMPRAADAAVCAYKDAALACAHTAAMRLQIAYFRSAFFFSKACRRAAASAMPPLCHRRDVSFRVARCSAMPLYAAADMPPCRHASLSR